MKNHILSIVFVLIGLFGYAQGDNNPFPEPHFNIITTNGIQAEPGPYGDSLINIVINDSSNVTINDTLWLPWFEEHLNISGTTFDNTVSAATGDETLFTFTGTVNKATSGEYTGIMLNITETSAPEVSNLLLDLQVGGNTTHSMSSIGDYYINSPYNANVYMDANTGYNSSLVFRENASSYYGILYNNSDNTLGFYNSQLGHKLINLAIASNADISIDPHGTGNIILGNFEIDADATIGAGQDNYVWTYDHSAGTWGPEASAGGGSLGNLIITGSDISTSSTPITMYGVEFGVSGTDRIQWAGDPTNNTYIDVNGTSYLLIRAQGEIQLQSQQGEVILNSSSLLPSVHNSRDIGEDGTEWRTGYFSTDVEIRDSTLQDVIRRQIDDYGGSSGPIYDFDTWTPSFTAYAGTPTITRADYVRIGAKVFYNISMQMDSNSDTDPFIINNLPFTTLTGGTSVATALVTSLGVPVLAYFYPNDTDVTLIEISTDSSYSYQDLSGDVITISGAVTISEP